MCRTRCYTNIHQVGGNVTVGNQTSTRAQPREITDLNNAKMTRELGGLNKVCSKKVLGDSVGRNPSLQIRNKKLNSNTTSSTKAAMPIKHYYKLPYVGNFSRIMQKKITKLLKRYCKPDLDIKLVFTTFKLRNLFGVKDFVPQSLPLRVVYKFQCASCNVCYIGETTRHLSTRIREHLVSDKSSHIYKHLQESETCKNSCSAESFTILDYATSKFQIKIKEALYIKWDNPSLNRQLKQLDLFLSF